MTRYILKLRFYITISKLTIAYVAPAVGNTRIQIEIYINTNSALLKGQQFYQC